MREVRARGYDALMLGTKLLQRVRLADPQAGIWEAADLQWWWRRPRRSDRLQQLFRVDGEAAAALYHGIGFQTTSTETWYEWPRALRAPAT